MLTDSGAMYGAAAFAILFAAFWFWVAPRLAPVMLVAYRLLGFPVRRDGFVRFFTLFNRGAALLIGAGISVGLILRWVG